MIAMNIHRHPCDYRGVQHVTQQGRVETPFMDAVFENVKHMQLVGHIDLYAPLKFVPLHAAAQKQADILREMGERVPDRCARFQLTAMLNQYLLCSSIVVAGHSNGDLSWVTKSPAALRGLFPELVPEHQQVGITRQLAEATPSYEEILNGRFVVLRVVPSEEGYSLERTTIPTETKLLPYFILHTFRIKLINYLRNEKVEIAYKQGKTVQQIPTTLRPEVLVSRFGVDPDRAAHFFPRDWHRGKSKLGVMNLPNLETGKFQPVPLHKIVHISDPKS
ncbi:hypothetical protein [Paenibacillus sp. DYY-L-2]|uniref:hypothetical protein n=1 Tax=Paenibacillus sp. DYY-L-2 TaxID=3447013 RepID=UPI003F507196